MGYHKNFPKETKTHMEERDLTTVPANASGGWSKLMDYFLKNPFLVLWNVVLILGGLITFAQFASIGYFPDLDIKTASSFLLGIALSGVSLVSILAAVMVLPSVLIRNEIWKPYFLHRPVEASQMQIRVTSEMEARRRIPFLVLCLFHGLMAFFAWMFIASFFIDDTHERYRFFVRALSGGGTGLLITGFAGVDFLWKRMDERDNAGEDGRRGHSRKAQHFFSIFIWVILYPGYLLLLLLAVGKLRENDMAGHLWVLGFTIALIVVNTGLAVTNFHSPKSYLIFPLMGTMLMVLYLSMPSNTLSITRAVFSSLAIGDLGSSRFVVKRQTCDAVNLLVPGACDVASETAGCIRPHTLANRIGNEYLLVLRVPGQAVPKSMTSKDQITPQLAIKVPIPKSEVLAWGTVDANDATWKACTQIGAASGSSIR
ncbi:hypothetical protein AB4Z32_08250 [Massilia sp. 2TAF26]|uniref:hypothetical protein n=1 Tax=Massilia sp. 2TAF26 TaxID=3233012 RepID=UPI003F9643C1